MDAYWIQTAPMFAIVYLFAHVYSVYSVCVCVWLMLLKLITIVFRRSATKLGGHTCVETRSIIIIIIIIILSSSSSLKKERKERTMK